MISLTILGVTVAAITGVIFWKQLGVMSGQLQEMKSGSVQTDRLVEKTGSIATNTTTAIEQYKQALAAALKDNRESLAKALAQNDMALNTTIEQNKNSLKASIGQLAAMQKHTEVSERPWLSLEASIASPFTFGADGARVTFQFTVKNSGKSPAVGVFLEPELYTLSLKKNPVAERRRLCSELIKRGPALGETVFPGEVMPMLNGLNLTPRDMAENSAPGGGGLFIYVIACVAYRPPFGEYPQAPYYTGILYDLSRSDPAHPNLSFVIKLGEDVPIQRLRFGPSVVFGTISQ